MMVPVKSGGDPGKGDRMKKWFLDQFLPMWAKETVLRDNRTLRRQLRQLGKENACLRAYIRGLEKGGRVVRQQPKGHRPG